MLAGLGRIQWAEKGQLTVEDETARRRLCCRNVRWRIMNDGCAEKSTHGRRRERSSKHQKKKYDMKFLAGDAHSGLAPA